MLALSLAGGADAARTLPVEQARIIHQYPHDTGAFTEGLFYLDGFLYESTGRTGASTIRKVALDSGKVVDGAVIPAPFFGEGIVAWRDEIVSLTWRHHRGFRWALADFARLGDFAYPGEGWALTSDGRRLIMSDGTARLRFLDPQSLRQTGMLRVTANGQPVPLLNELEYVNGEILANIWHDSRIARIDPASGRVRGWIDLSSLVAKVGATDPESVPNGIAWDSVGKRLFVTGKNWPIMFEIAPPRR